MVKVPGPKSHRLDLFWTHFTFLVRVEFYFQNSVNKVFLFAEIACLPISCPVLLVPDGEQERQA